MSNQLDEYTEKRDLQQSGEPSEGVSEKFGEKPFFVVQKHDASSLHYDFRLKIGDTLASRAVPKGPSIDTSTKRLAIKTDDHPIAYADFEGVIPEGNYGAGAVMVWDRGEYDPKEGEDPQEMLEAGQLEVYLKGEKLQGGFALVRIDDDKDQWLLIKMDDDNANRDDRSVDKLDKSVISGKDIDQIQQDATSE